MNQLPRACSTKASRTASTASSGASAAETWSPEKNGTLTARDYGSPRDDLRRRPARRASERGRGTRPRGSLGAREPAGLRGPFEDRGGELRPRGERPADGGCRGSRGRNRATGGRRILGSRPQREGL